MAATGKTDQYSKPFFYSIAGLVERTTAHNLCLRGPADDSHRGGFVVKVSPAVDSSTLTPAPGTPRYPTLS